MEDQASRNSFCRAKDTIIREKPQNLRFKHPVILYSYPLGGGTWLKFKLQSENWACIEIILTVEVCPQISCN